MPVIIKSLNFNNLCITFSQKTGMLFALYIFIKYYSKGDKHMRIIDHGVLGHEPERKKIKIFFEGSEIEAYEGDPVAVALIDAGIKDFRVTRKKGEPRGVFCAIGRCTDCMMTIDGIANVRTCITPVRNGMTVERGKGIKGGGGNDKD